MPVKVKKVMERPDRLWEVVFVDAHGTETMVLLDYHQANLLAETIVDKMFGEDK